MSRVSRTLQVSVIAVCAALVGLLAYGLTSTGSDTSLDQALLDGERPQPEALGMELPVLGGNGESTSPAAYEGKVVLLNVWASWCGPCEDELPLLQETHEELADQGGLVLGVNARDFTDKALAMVDEYDLTFPSLRDRDAELAREFGATAYPETILLDRQGRVADIRRGPVTQEWLDETLPPLLAEKA